MSVSGVGPSNFNYPAEPPPNGNVACALSFVSQLSEIADKLGASGKGGSHPPHFGPKVH
jgi:hypothetical protein